MCSLLGARRVDPGRMSAATQLFSKGTPMDTHPDEPSHLSAYATQRGAEMIQATSSPDDPELGRAVTVALVHGAFADSSSWLGVIANLQASGLVAQAISNPLRGVSADAAYVASAVS